MQESPQTLSWFGIVRLGLVQTALGSVTVLTMATLNRVMVVELALPSMLPGLLVGLHYAMQLLRPRLGYGSDLGGRRTPWIVGGMALHAAGGALAAVATALMASHLLRRHRACHHSLYDDRHRRLRRWHVAAGVARANGPIPSGEVLPPRSPGP